MESRLPIESATILVVDDERANIDLLAKMLERAGFANVVGEQDPRNVRSCCEEHDPDLLILDLTMPGKSGFDVLSELDAAGFRERLLPILVYTGHDESESRRRAFELGATDFITKATSDWFEVSLRVRNLLGIRCLQKQLEAQNASLEAQVRERTADLEKANAAMVIENMERLQATDALRKAENRLRFLLTSSPVSIRAFRPHPPYSPVFVSDNIINQIGYHAGEFEANPSLWKDRLHADDAPRVWEKLQLLDAEDRQIDEYRLFDKSGNCRWFRDERRVIRDKEGVAIEVVAAWVDITERKDAEEKLARQAMELASTNASLEEFDRLKSDFVATASHEMRTPLTVIREFVNLIKDDVVGPTTAEQQECLESTIRNCDRLAGLLDNLLDFHKIEAGKLYLARTKADIRQVVETCKSDFEPKCRAQGIELKCEIPPALPPVLCDSELVSQVLVNLLGNAAKFTPEGGQIWLRVKAMRREVSIEVADTGCGISPENQQAIFEAFRQVNRTEGPGVRGTGLGLTISKKIVEMHGGTIQVESAPGEGSKFRFTVPLWSESSSFVAFVADRWNNASSREADGSLLLLRLAPRPISAEFRIEDLERLQSDVRPVIRAGEEGRLVLSEQCIAYVLETDMGGAAIALDRIRNRILQAGWALGNVEYSLAHLTPKTTVQETIEEALLHWRPVSLTIAPEELQTCHI